MTEFLEALLEVGREGDIETVLAALAALPNGDSLKQLAKSMALMCGPALDYLHFMLP